MLVGVNKTSQTLAARLGCQSTMAGTGWANSCPGCMDRLRKCCSHLVGGSFLAGKAAWTLSGCLPTESADYWMLVNQLFLIAHSVFNIHSCMTVAKAT